MTRESVPARRYVGRFAALQGRAAKAWSGDARSLVGQELYAFRTCTSHCDEPLGSAVRSEELILIGPSALWDGSSTGAARTPVETQPF